MRFSYDKDADALDISLAEGVVARTVEIDSGTLVDVDVAGAALAIEIIRPARPVPIEQIIERFEVDDREADVLRSLWADTKRYPFETARELATA